LLGESIRKRLVFSGSFNRIGDEIYCLVQLILFLPQLDVWICGDSSFQRNGYAVTAHFVETKSQGILEVLRQSFAIRVMSPPEFFGEFYHQPLVLEQFRQNIEVHAMILETTAEEFVIHKVSRFVAHLAPILC
jgi:hypothetical protein